MESGLVWRLLATRGGFALTAYMVFAGCAVRQPEPGPTGPWVTDWSAYGLTGRRITTEHFDIFSTLTDGEFEAAVPGFLESAYTWYVDTLPSSLNPKQKLTTYVFGTRFEWERFARRRYPDRFHVYTRIQSGGFTEGSTAVIFYVARAGTWATLAHEGWHQYVAARTKTAMPAWLNEGLACYHESIDLAGSSPKWKPLHNTFRINSLREAIQQDTVLSLRELVQTDAGRIISRHHGGVAQVYYAQAWALITFLRHGAEGRFSSSFEKMLGDLVDGSFAVRVSAARLGQPGAADLSLAESVFPTYFGCGVDDIAEAYRRHLLQVAGF